VLLRKVQYAVFWGGNAPAVADFMLPTWVTGCGAGKRWAAQLYARFPPGRCDWWARRTIKHSEAIRKWWLSKGYFTFFFFFAVLELKLRAYTSSLFLWLGFFRVLQTVCLSWLRTVTLLISASWVARITSMRYQHRLII
jgi:hypothetical protein